MKLPRPSHLRQAKADSRGAISRSHISQNTAPLQARCGFGFPMITSRVVRGPGVRARRPSAVRAINRPGGPEELSPPLQRWGSMQESTESRRDDRVYLAETANHERLHLRRKKNSSSKPHLLRCFSCPWMYRIPHIPSSRVFAHDDRRCDVRRRPLSSRRDSGLLYSFVPTAKAVG